MPLLFMTLLVIQVILAIHVVRSGNDRYWVFIICFPLIGGVVYFLAVILPGMFRSRGTTKFIHAVKNKVNPERNLKGLQEELLLYVRALADTGRTEQAEQELIELIEYYSGHRRVITMPVYYIHKEKPGTPLRNWKLSCCWPEGQNRITGNFTGIVCAGLKKI